jgi:hypothetical protein
MMTRRLKTYHLNGDDGSTRRGTPWESDITGSITLVCLDAWLGTPTSASLRPICTWPLMMMERSEICSDNDLPVIGTRHATPITLTHFIAIG